MPKPSREFIASLEVGTAVNIDNGSAGIVRAKVTRMTDKVLFIRYGKETRRFSKADGGTLNSPSSSKAWLAPVEVTHA